MNNPVEILKDEHKLLLNAVKVAKRIQNLSDDETYYELIRDMILFLRNYTETYHHPKEEYYLYPLLQNRAKGMNSEFVHEICDNHQEFKALMAAIENHFVMYDYRLLRITMNEYLVTLEEHIKRENRLILSIAENLLTREELNKVYKDFVVLDKKDGGKDQFRKSFVKLSKRMPMKL